MVDQIQTLPASKSTNHQKCISTYNHFHSNKKQRMHCRIIFHTEDVDALYYYLRNDDTASKLGKFETKPTDADWGERYFQMRDPDGYEIVFATPIT